MSRLPPARRLAFALVLLPALGAPASAQTQPSTPPAIAAVPAAALPASAPASPAGSEGFPARGLVQIFVDACVATGGNLQPAVDWAVTQGFQPQDAEATGSRALLDDRPGSIFSPPGLEGRVMLAIAGGGHCLVWADRAHGPGVRLSLQAALGERASRGDRLEVELDRKVERGQAWRQQTQWRLRPAGQPTGLQIGLLNTVTDLPAPQVIRLQTVAVAPAFAPDGLPQR